jgi:hypothetical protein
MKKVTKYLSTIAPLLIVSSGRAFADVDFVNQIPNAVKTGPTIAELVSNVVNTLSFIAGVACVIAIIAGGIMYITSAGDENKVRTAKNTLLYAIIGVIISISAYAISAFVVGRIQ